MIGKWILTVALLVLVPTTTTGCVAVLLGATAAGGGYEAHQAAEMEDVEEDYQAGRISKEEYEIRKKQIDETSVFQ